MRWTSGPSARHQSRFVSIGLFRSDWRRRDFSRKDLPYRPWHIGRPTTCKTHSTRSFLLGLFGFGFCRENVFYSRPCPGTQRTIYRTWKISCRRTFRTYTARFSSLCVGMTGRKRAQERTSARARALKSLHRERTTTRLLLQARQGREVGISAS